MATSIPVDVMRDIRNKVADMKSKANDLRQEGNEKFVRADVLYNEALKLELLYDKWLAAFPDTVVP